MIMNYIKLALRNIFRQKGYNFLNVAGLGVGIATGLIIALHIRDELSFEKSFANYERIFRVHRENWAASSPALADEFSVFFPDVESIGRFSLYGTRVVNTTSNNPGEVTGYYADATVLDVFGLKVLRGDQGPLVALSTAVITESMAKRYFGNDDPIGQILKFDNQEEFPVTAVIADVPVNSHLKFDFLISMPTFYQQAQNADAMRGWMSMYTYARLKPGSYEGVVERMPDFIKEYYKGDPELKQKIESKAWRLMPLADIHLHSNLEKEMGPNSSILYIYVFVAVEFLILLVASANFISLFTTQAIRRMKEVGMRRVLGARRLQLTGQFLTEVLLLIFIAVIVSIGLYQIAIPFYNDLSGKSLGPWQIFELRNIVTIGLILLALVLITGLYPAFFIARFRAGNFLKEDKLPKSMPNLVRNGLLIFQFVVSMSLIAAAIVVQRQMTLVKNKDLGFDKDQVINIKLYGHLWWLAFSEGDAFKNEFLQNPDVLAVGRVDRIIGERLSVESVLPDGKDPDRDDFPDVRVLRADEGYVEAMDIDIVAGRNFSRQFNDSSSYIVNESAARAFKLSDPVGEVLNSHSRGRKGKIVGVIRDYHFASLHAEIEPLVIEYEPGWTSHLVFKVRAGKTKEALNSIESTVDRLSPNTLFVYQFLDDRLNALYRSEQTMGRVFQFFSLMAMGLACIGLFGLSAYMIESRRKEIGIRKILGATVQSIFILFSLKVFRLIVTGFAVAIPLTWYFATRWLENFAYKIDLHWSVFLISSFLILIISFAVVSFHTITAAKSNPVNSLHSE